jgi:hypothetical protein
LLRTYQYCIPYLAAAIVNNNPAAFPFHVLTLVEHHEAVLVGGVDVELVLFGARLVEESVGGD